MENGSQFNHTESLHAQTIRPHKEKRATSPNV